MNLVINNLFKTVLLSLTLAVNSISCVSAKPLPEVSKISITPVIVQKNQSNLETNQNVKLEFNTNYGFDEICNQRKSIVTWSTVEEDLAKYGIGMDKVNWLFSSDACTKVVDPKLNYITIRELRDKNSSLYVYYIHHTKENKRILVKIIRNSGIQPMSQGRREYFGDFDSFLDGKFIIDKFIDTQIDFY